MMQSISNPVYGCMSDVWTRLRPSDRFSRILINSLKPAIFQASVVAGITGVVAYSMGAEEAALEMGVKAGCTVFAMLYPIAYRHFEYVEKLYEIFERVNGSFPGHSASAREYIRAVVYTNGTQQEKESSIKELIQEGITSNDHSILDLAVSKADPSMVRFLLEKGVEPNLVDNCDIQSSALFRACTLQDDLGAEIIPILIEYGTSLETVERVLEVKEVDESRPLTWIALAKGLEKVHELSVLPLVSEYFFNGAHCLTNIVSDYLIGQCIATDRIFGITRKKSV